MSKSTDYDWNERAISILREMWSQGYSASQIGRSLNVGKNAVIGKANRIGLPKRPNPCVRKTLSSEREVRAIPKRVRQEQFSKPVTISEPRRHVTPRKSEPCRWPIGFPKQPGFHFCDAAGVPGRSYCEEHMQIAYVRRGDAE